MTRLDALAGKAQRPVPVGDLGLAPVPPARPTAGQGWMKAQLRVEPGRHTLQVRGGRNSSRTKAFEAAEGEIVAFRCSGKSIVPIFLLPFVVPSLALSLHRE